MTETKQATYNDLPVRRVKVVVSLEFDAFVTEEPADGYFGGSLEHKIGAEVADAIEYRAVHLSDSEEGDALIALPDGGSGYGVGILAVTVAALDEPVTSEEVAEAVEHTKGWM